MARRRVDPPSVPADGHRNYDGLTNARQDKEYRWVAPDDDLCGLGPYLATGWELERPVREPGALKPVGARAVNDSANGEVWTRLGQVLVSRDSAAGVEEFTRGQKVADAFDARMLKSGNIEDGLRGQGFRLGVDKQVTTGPTVELER